MMGLGLSFKQGANTPRSQFSNAVLDVDFRSNRYLVSGENLTSADFLTTTRAASAYAQDGAGIWQSFSANQPRLTNKGLLIEPAQTYQPTNANFAGAAVGIVDDTGALPTGWTNNEMTTEVIALGTELGLPYIELRMSFDNASGSTQYPRIVFPNANASNGQTWTASCGYRKTAGTWPIYAGYATIAEGGSDGTTFHEVARPDQIDSFARFAFHWTNAKSNPIEISPRFIAFTIADGESFDVTTRLYAPQLEQNRDISAPVLTTDSGTATRPMDAVRADDIATVLAGMSRTIIIFDIDIPAPYSGPNTPSYFSIDNGSATEAISFGTNSSGDYLVSASSSGSSDSLNLGSMSTGQNRVAFGIESDGSISASLNGQTVQTSASALDDLSTLSQAHIGANASGVAQAPATHRTIALIDTDPTTQLLEQFSAI